MRSHDIKSMVESNQPGVAHRVSFDTDSGRSLSTAVAFAVAEARGVDPVDLAPDTVLADLVDTEVLDVLVDDDRPAPEEWEFEFSLGGEMVNIASDGTITVRQG
ncbi:HalOD1 output domain-containing protein [Halobium salinum]|uniref:HalOD1 output domain-containing protein n=1 Tax=Halobium salinum TaxID=1364940 RepID=A0ABD5P7B8_9EURY|nr:HalOD1 output domain-containing protein [Halobium salinum]